MGQCLSLDHEELKARARSEAIDRDLQTWAKKDQNVIKILLLGAAEGGKSTLVKQMKIIHNDGFSYDELLSFKPASGQLTRFHEICPHWNGFAPDKPGKSQKQTTCTGNPDLYLLL